MIKDKWSARHITCSAQCMLEQIPARASDRGLHVVDAASIVQLALWSLLLWERKVGRVALERMGVEPFELARRVDDLLTKKASQHPIAYDQSRGIPVLVKSGELYVHWNFEELLEPLLQQAEHEALDMSHNYVGSEHLLLAIVQIADASLTALLEQHGIRHEYVKNAVLDLLSC